MRKLIQTKHFSFGIDTFYPDWHIGKPKECCDVRWEISLGIFYFGIWRNEE